MPRPLRVFLCHASQDKPDVRELYNALKTESWIEPWLDEEKISFGQHWTTVIEKAIDESDVVLIFLSRNSVHKEGFVQRELNYAWEISLEKPRDVIFLIPFRLDNCEIPRFLNSRQWGDFFGGKKKSTYQILLRSLKLRYEQKISLEKLEQDAREIVALEEAKREAAEKAAREKIRREHLQWEIAENAVREKAERDAEQKAKLKKTATGSSLPIALGGLGILVLIGIFVAVIFLAVKWLSPFFVPTPTEAPPATKLPAQESPVITELFIITDAPTEAQDLGAGSTMTGTDGMTLLYVPAGEFTMGSDKGDPDEKPVHMVNLDAFWIDQTEVTNEMYSMCVTADVCKQPSHKGSFTNSRYYGNPAFNHYPVIYVDWDMAKTYCEWVGRDLPTEAQWEKAARGPDAKMYPWGNTFNGKLVNFCDTNCSADWANKGYNDDYADVSPVGNYPSGQSVYGVLDMAGNVWEWADDWYDVYPGGTTTSSKFGQKYKVLRGGSWFVNMHDVRTADRYWVDLSDSSNYFTGFRCARSAE
jgi:formylglycine-generating enzyme required for sulfatase activity